MNILVILETTDEALRACFTKNETILDANGGELTGGVSEDVIASDFYASTKLEDWKPATDVFVMINSGELPRPDAIILISHFW